MNNKIDLELLAVQNQESFGASSELESIFNKLTEDIESYRKDQTEILEYCRPHTDQMWAAKIVSIILGCDFRDATPAIAKYFVEIEK
jgi:hypothetical protein